jgi:uncharacterized membrane protein YdjX (TVP38/TMEM64 family)
MRTVLLNAVVIFIVASPITLLELLRRRSHWVERHHEELGLAAWLVTLIAVYIWVLPRVRLQPNPRFFNP